MKIFLYLDKPILKKYLDDNGNFDSKNEYFFVDFDPKLSLYRTGFLKRVVGNDPVLVIAETDSEFYSYDRLGFFANRFRYIAEFKNPLEAIPDLEKILSRYFNVEYESDYFNKKISSFYFKLVLDAFEMVASGEISEELFDSIRLVKKPFSVEVLWSHSSKNWNKDFLLEMLNVYGTEDLGYDDYKRIFFTVSSPKPFNCERKEILSHFLNCKDYESTILFLQHLKRKKCNDFIHEWIKENYDKLTETSTNNSELSELLKWCKLSISGYVLKESSKKEEMFFKTKGELTTYLIREGYTDFDNASKFVDELIKEKKWFDIGHHWGELDDEDIEYDLILSLNIEEGC